MICTQRHIICAVIYALVLGGLYYASQMAGLSPMLHHGISALLFALIIAVPLLIIAYGLRGFLRHRSVQSAIILGVGVLLAVVIIPKYWERMKMHAQVAMNTEKAPLTEIDVVEDDVIEDDADFDDAEYEDDYADYDDQEPVIVEEEVDVAPVQVTRVKTVVTTPQQTQVVAPAKTQTVTPTKTVATKPAKTEVVDSKKATAPAGVVEINSDSELKNLIARGKKENKTVVVKVYMTKCPPCIAMKPHFEKVADNHPELIFAEVEGPTSRIQFAGLRGYPTIVIYKNGKEVSMDSGGRDAKGIEALITQAKNK